VLLSRYEGLPNVLIEAQYMGVRVVTTPAGGAAECLIDGVTGHVLGCAERPDYDEIIDRAHDFARRSDDIEMFEPGGVARTFLDSHFSVAHMLSQYVQCTARGLERVASVRTVAPQSLQAA
jgi:glycosyltransferase involved in cell wall biosynthesis